MMEFQLPEPFSILFVIVLNVLLYWTGISIYRLYFHPIAKFPGPRLAAVSFWYEFYYDVWPNQYRYMWKIQKLHERYGPIIRINPNHLHIHDPDYIDEIYTNASRKRDRDSWFMHSTKGNYMGWSLLQTMDHELHRRRRAALNPFFSKRNVQDLEPMITQLVAQLSHRINLAYKTGDIINLSYAMAALTMDMISTYCFGTNMGTLRDENWGKDWLNAFRYVGQIRPTGRQFPWLMNAMILLPPQIVLYLNPGVAKMMKKLYEPIEIIKSLAQSRNTYQPSSTKTRTVFKEILDAPLPESEKTIGRLNAEASLLLGAGTETTARTLAVTCYYVYENPILLEEIREELRRALPDPATKSPSVSNLENLPLFSAVVLEGLRMAHGITSRQPRIAVDEILQYKEWFIPIGTPVMQSIYLHHTNPSIFPDPFKFHPHRWIETLKLRRYFMSFGRGTRNCIGMNLAMAEIHICLAHIFKRFDMDSFDTSLHRDVETTNDCFIGSPSLESPGIRMRIVKDLYAA